MRGALALVRGALALVRGALALVRGSLALVRGALALREVIRVLEKVIALDPAASAALHEEASARLAELDDLPAAMVTTLRCSR